MTVVLRKWKVRPARATFDFELDEVSHRALLDLFDDLALLSPLERQAGLLYLLSALTSKPRHAAALSAHVERILMGTGDSDRRPPGPGVPKESP